MPTKTLEKPNIIQPNPQKPNKPKLAKTRKALGRLWRGLALIFAAALIISLFTPVPVAMLIRLIFTADTSTAPSGFDQIKQQVQIIENLEYPSHLGRNTADVFLPINAKTSVPVVLWVPGGAFVGGGKNDITTYATVLASRGYGVVCMNYMRAPEAAYPSPLLQIGQAYNWLEGKAGEYNFDTSRVIIAGDSAGAHMAAQFIAVQTNPEYASGMGIEPVIASEKLKAALLFCGPYEADRIAGGKDMFMNYLLEQPAWAYFGTSDWRSQYAYQATVTNHVTKDFPPAFISDGNTLSFEDHGRALAAALKSKQVAVETYFTPVEQRITVHEFQRLMHDPVAMDCFERTIEFLDIYCEKI